MKSFSCLAILASLLAVRSALGSVYLSQEGDSLSDIAHRFLGGPVWGRKGTFYLLLKKNPEFKTNPNRLLVGREIQIDDSLRIDRAPTSVSSPSPAAPVATPVAMLDQQDESVGTQAQPPAQTGDLAPVGVSSGTSDEASARVQAATSANSHEASYQASHLAFGPRFLYERLDSKTRSTQGSATLGSQLSLGAGLDWNLNWSQSWSSQISIGFDTWHVQPTNIAVERSSFTHTFLSLAVAREFSTHTRLVLSGMAETSPFLQPASASSATLDSGGVSSLAFGVEQTLLRGRLLSLEVGASGAYRFGASTGAVRVRAGSDWKAHLQILQTHGQCPLESEIFYRHVTQGTSETTQTEEVLGITLRLSFNLGETESH